MKTLKKIITLIQEDIVGTDNRFIAMSWLACIAGLVGLGFYLSSESMSFLGVADSRERQINFEYPVEIKRIHVLAGQSVRKGDLLLELNQSELNGRIRLVRSQISKLEAEFQVRQHLNAIVSNSKAMDTVDPLTVDIQDLKTELDYLENQKKNLYVFADVDGIVGAVSFKKGEKVPSFTSVVTLSPARPSYIEGFIHENLNTKLNIGQKVTVKGLSSSHASIEGEIVSVGSRIILIPPRLMTYPNMQVWGREVVVEIPAQNNFLLGEKVQIKPKWEIIRLSTALASDKGDVVPAGTSENKKVEFAESLSKRFQFEPSGMIYLSDVKKFLVVSDDTDDDKSPVLFLMDKDGKVEEPFLTIPGIDKISDLESISQDGEHIYLLTSQGLTKKKKDKRERNLLVRVKRTGLDLHDAQVVEFKPLLVKALQAAKDKTLRDVLAKSKDELEIEGHYVQSDELYLSFKAPLLDGHKSILVKVSGVNALFKDKKLKASQVSLWKTVDFGNAEGAPHRISDMALIEGSVYVTTVSDKEDSGAVWKMREDKGALQPELIKSFPGLKPEGLVLVSSEKSLYVVFDEKEKTAQYVRLPVNAKGSVSNEKK